jgi:hypothetical protein
LPWAHHFPYLLFTWCDDQRIREKNLLCCLGGVSWLLLERQWKWAMSLLSATACCDALVLVAVGVDIAHVTTAAASSSSFRFRQSLFPLRLGS